MNKMTSSFKHISLLALGIFLVAPSLAGADSSRNYTPANDSLTLKPGWVSSCQNDFVVENLGDEHAQVIIKLGIEDFKTDSIPKWEKRAYDIRHELTLAKQLGKTVHIDDVALIHNKSGTSEVRVHC